jgi:hypothetical protein
MRRINMIQFTDNEEAEEWLIARGYTKVKAKKGEKRVLYKGFINGTVMEVKKSQVIFNVKL